MKSRRRMGAMGTTWWSRPTESTNKRDVQLLKLAFDQEKSTLVGPDKNLGIDLGMEYGVASSLHTTHVLGGDSF